MGTFQQIVEFITNFGYNIRYRELCWIINGFNSKGLGNNFTRVLRWIPAINEYFWGKKSYLPGCLWRLTFYLYVCISCISVYCRGHNHPSWCPHQAPCIYTRLAKEKKNATTLSLQRCFVTCYTHSSGDSNGKNIHEQGIYKIRVISRILPLGYC